MLASNSELIFDEKSSQSNSESELSGLLTNK